MPYGMQGSDKSTKLSIGYTHKKYFSTNSLGFQIQSSLNANEKNWAFGNKYETSIWFQKVFNNSLSWSLRYNFVKEIGLPISILGINKGLCLFILYRDLFVVTAFL